MELGKPVKISDLIRELRQQLDLSQDKVCGQVGSFPANSESLGKWIYSAFANGTKAN
ncbi:hypothetical protein [uncultured Nostoc sp.]|uniref:hypothetical protein n=1 Tax=uncultured Nostoc sp. TaxID=340711 RepID=UPI0035CB458B